MASLHVIFGLALPPIKNSGYAYARGEGFLGRALQITACVSQARVNCCTSARGPASFCQKTGHHKRFFSMKQQDKSSERDQVA